MSVIGYREWQIWANLDLFNSATDIRGVVYLKITPSLMVENTVGFIYEKIEQIRQGVPQFENEKLKKYFDLSYITPTSEIVIQKSTIISPDIELIQPLINETLEELEAISLCLDFPLTCNEIRFVIPAVQPLHGELFIASRKSIGRGMAFELEERGSALNRLQNDFEKFVNFNPTQRVAARHYLNGLTILGLEDQFSGLIDAAFMQFYQACEVLCGGNFKLKDVKIYIANHYSSEYRTLQLITHHVWQIRHNYFGHGNVENNIANLENPDQTFNIAKQVLVARWLCKRLLDLNTHSHPLSREMRLYNKLGSVYFSGSIELLKSDFYTGYDFKNAPVLDSSGTQIEVVALG